MSSEVENGYTFRMGDHEITMRDSFSSMLDTTQLTDSLLICHTHLKDGQTADTVVAFGNGLTNGHSSPVPASGSRTLTAKTDQILRTHRVILSASSDYFRSIFSSVPNTLNNGVVAVIITNVDFDDLQSIIDFIYKGQVSVGQSRIHKFLAAAQLLMVKGLMNIKLVNNEDQPIDDKSFVDNELIQKLRSEKRILEQEIKTVKELEKSKTDRLRRELEIEIKKKFEIEKSVLSEEKQRFEAERMKFTIEKELFEKNKVKDFSHKTNNSNTNIINTNNTSNKIVLTNNSNKSVLVDSLTQNSDQINKTNQNESNNTRVLRGTPIKTVGQTIITAQIASKVDKSGNSLTESPSLETEGRQLRKRIKLSDISGDCQQTTTDNSTKDDEQQMEVEDEDGEVYEVDFSQNQEVCQSSDGQPEPNQTEANTSDATPKTNDINTTPQSAAIVASAMAAFHKGSVSSTSTPSQVNTRNLRRSTSSIGSASTQSMGGENGAEGDSTVVLRRKGRGRTPHWVKDEGLEGTELDSPLTRTKQHGDQPIQSPGTHLYSCPYCPQVYHGNNAMQDHINGVHLNQKTQYICDFCGKVYTWRISLNKHLRTVHPNEVVPD